MLVYSPDAVNTTPFYDRQEKLQREDIQLSERLKSISIMGAQLRPPLNLLKFHSTILQGALRGVLNYAESIFFPAWTQVQTLDDKVNMESILHYLLYIKNIMLFNLLNELFIQYNLTLARPQFFTLCFYKKKNATKFSFWVGLIPQLS